MSNANMEAAKMNCSTCGCPPTCIVAHLKGSELLEISEMMNSLRYERGQIIWQEGIFRPGCFIICNGSAEMTVRSVEGKRRIVRSFRAGDLIPCLDGGRIGEPTQEFVVQVGSTTPVLLRYLPTESFGYLVIRYPSIAMKVIERLSTAVLQLIHELGVSSYCDVRTRVARVLIHLQEASQLRQPPPSQQVIAELVGASREAVNKALHSLAEEEILSIEHRHIKVLDDQRLQELQM